MLAKSPELRAILQCWQLIASEVNAGLHVRENHPWEVHGELLSRIWSEIRYGEPGTYILSETDFIPRRSLLCDLMYELAVPRFRCTSHFTRDAHLELVDHWPLSAPWFMTFDLCFRPPAWPPVDWLAAGGPFNDAANLAAQNAVKSKFALAKDIRWLEVEDAAPLMGAHLKGYGTHCFFARHFLDSPDTVLLPGSGYTVQEHKSRIRELLRQMHPSIAADLQPSSLPG